MKRLSGILAWGCLLFLLVACMSGGTQIQKNGTPLALAPTPTRPGVPPGTVLYQSDWSKGLAIWGGSVGWKLVDGQPQSDLSANNALTLPYTLTVSDYAFEFRFQIVSVPQNGGYFVLKATRTQTKNGYVAGILRLLSPAPHSEFANPQIQVMLDPIDAMELPVAPTDYEPGSGWHTYRVEVRGPEVKLLADGLRKGITTSNQTSSLSNGPLQLISSGAIVRVSNVSVTAL